MSNDKKLNATQRLENLESALMQAYQTMNNMASDLLTAKEAIKLLGNKLESVKILANISDDDVATQMVANNVTELKERADALVAQGTLVASEVVAEDSFVVGKESDETGKIVNPRLQFAMSALQPDIRAKIVGSKSGDILDLQEGKLKFEVSEIYAIVNPDAAPAATETAPVQEEAAQ